MFFLNTEDSRQKKMDEKHTIFPNYNLVKFMKDDMVSDLPLWIEMYARFAKPSGYGLYAICLGQIRAKNN
jgi:hypothetical protein